MGNTGKQLAARFREVMLDGTWIANTNYKDQLVTLDYQTATKTIGSHNSIALLAQHIHYFITGVKTVFKGGELTISDRKSFDFNPITSQKQWHSFLNQLWKDAEQFSVLVENLTDKQLNHVFVKEEYGTYLRNIDGMIEHCYYHLGQIVLLKKRLLATD